MSAVRVLFLADTHLGFDLPARPRVERRRRGHDFFANYLRALDVALAGGADLVVHGGDVFYRSRVPAGLVHEAFEPLRRVADAGVPVYVVPGNHERSRMPVPLLTVHPRIHVFHEPAAFVVDVRGVRVVLAGFPYCRNDVRRRFTKLVEETGWQSLEADVRLLCVHHCFEGATVGPSDFTFRGAPDVVRAADLPRRFAAVLTGHVHRHQVLTADLHGRPLPMPVLYPGSIERTSFAEKDEPKGFLVLDLEPDDSGGSLVGWTFERLPARPMVVIDIPVDGGGAGTLERKLRTALAEPPEDAVVRVRILGSVPDRARPVLAAARVRSLAPPTMNVEVAVLEDRGRWRQKEPGSRRPAG